MYEYRIANRAVSFNNVPSSSGEIFKAGGTTQQNPPSCPSIHRQQKRLRGSKNCTQQHWKMDLLARERGEKVIRSKCIESIWKRNSSWWYLLTDLFRLSIRAMTGDGLSHMFPHSLHRTPKHPDPEKPPSSGVHTVLNWPRHLCVHLDAFLRQV